MPKVIKRRFEKKPEKEEFTAETVINIRERLKQRQRTLVYSAVVGFFLLLTAVAIIVYVRTTASKALEFELEAYRAFYGDFKYADFPPAERFKKSLEMFEKSYGAKKKPQTLLYIANCHYEMGNYDEAIKTLKELNSRFTDIGVVSPSYYKLAMAYIKKGELEIALDSLKSLVSIKDSSLQDMALLESGKILEFMGKTEDAKKSYKELIDKFPKSVLLNEAQMRLEGKIK